MKARKIHGIWSSNALMSKCCVSNHNWKRKDIISFDIKKIVGHAGGDPSFLSLTSTTKLDEKKNLYHNEKEVKATCEM